MEQERTTGSKRLYYVTSWVPELSHRGSRYAHVRIEWLVVRDRGEEPPVPYEDAIVDYGQPTAEGNDWSDAEACVNELFTEAEAKSLQAYLLAVHGDRAVVTELALPLDCQNMIPYSAVPVRSSSGLYLLHEEPGYNLDVKVQGFYDVENSALITTETSVRADDVSF